MYTMYINNYDMALSTVGVVTSRSSRFENFLEGVCRASLAFLCASRPFFTLCFLFHRCAPLSTCARTY